MDLRDSQPTSQQLTQLTRRQFLLRNLALLTTAVLGEEVGGRNTIETTIHRVPIKNLREPMRVTQISDLHRSWCVSEHFISQCVNRAIQTQPDAFLLTGDFVTGVANYSTSCATQLQRLNAPMGQFAILGNHDWGCNLGSGGREVAYNISQADIRILTNRSFVLDNGLQIVGVDDAVAGRPDPDKAFGKVEWNRPVIAMTHNPILFKTKMCQYPCLTLAGHTHGGQIKIPGVTPLFMKLRRTHRNMPPRYEHGWVEEPNSPGTMYVSRGLGVVGIPMRFRARPEIVVFDLIPA
jgi:uncharacterized protein